MLDQVQSGLMMYKSMRLHTTTFDYTSLILCLLCCSSVLPLLSYWHQGSSSPFLLLAKVNALSKQLSYCIHLTIHVAGQECIRQVLVTCHEHYHNTFSCMRCRKVPRFAETHFYFAQNIAAHCADTVPCRLSKNTTYSRLEVIVKNTVKHVADHV